MLYPRSHNELIFLCQLVICNSYDKNLGCHCFFQWWKYHFVNKTQFGESLVPPKLNNSVTMNPFCEEKWPTLPKTSEFVCIEITVLDMVEKGWEELIIFINMIFKKVPFFLIFRTNISYLTPFFLSFTVSYISSFGLLAQEKRDSLAEGH